MDNNNLHGSIDDVQEKKKKHRSRKKKLLQDICHQFEFYFSDANLGKDRFLLKKIMESKSGYLPLDLFIKFNKLANLTTDKNLMIKALASSKLLSMNESNTHLRRIIPFERKNDVDDRTIYIEPIPQGCDHDYIKNIFNRFGNVLYVSLPKFHTTGDLKGFGFVEFDTIDSAKRAVDLIDCDKTANIGKFPRLNKEGKILERQIKQMKEEVLFNNLTEDKSKNENHKDENETITINSNKIVKDGSDNNSILKQKRKVSDSDDYIDNIANPNKKAKIVRINDQIEINNQKKKRIRKRKILEDFPSELKVISKKEWLELKKEYLMMQKESMKQLKDSLKVWKQKSAKDDVERKVRENEVKTDVLKNDERQRHKEDRDENGKPVLIPKTILKVVLKMPLKWTDIEEILRPSQPHFIDIEENSTEGYIRCKTIIQTNQILSRQFDSLSFHKITDSEEALYFESVLKKIEDRRVEKKKRKKERGTKKLLNAVGKIKETNQHVIFDD